MPCLPLSEYQPPGQLEVSSKGYRVRSEFYSNCLEYLQFFRYLYYQSFGVDACFRFKRREISSYQKDPELGPGFAYVVAWESYKSYLLDHAEQKDVSDFLIVLGLRLMMFCRPARVLGYPLSSTQIPSSPGVILPLGLYAQHAATSSFSLKGPVNFKRVKSLYRTSSWLVLFAYHALSGMLTLITLSSGAHVTTLSRRRLPPTTLCVSGPRTFASD